MNERMDYGSGGGTKLCVRACVYGIEKKISMYLSECPDLLNHLNSCMFLAIRAGLFLSFVSMIYQRKKESGILVHSRVGNPNQT